LIYGRFQRQQRQAVWGERESEFCTYPKTNDDVEEDNKLVFHYCFRYGTLGFCFACTERERESGELKQTIWYSERLAVGIGLVGGGGKVFMRKRLGNDEILIDGGPPPAKKESEGVGLANGKRGK